MKQKVQSFIAVTPTVLKKLFMMILATQNHQQFQPILSNTAENTALVYNIKSKMICAEEQPECWRLDNKPATLRRAWLLYGDI